MNFKLKTSLIIGAIVASSLVYAATVISPNQNNNSGSIPSGYSDLEFNLANGNWVKTSLYPQALIIWTKLQFVLVLPIVVI